MTATSGLTSAMAEALLSASTGEATLTAFGGSAGTVKLNSAVGSETTAGTNISGGSYPSAGIPTGTSSTTWGSPSYSSGVASITNSGLAITQTSMPAVTVLGAELWDGAGTPVRWWWGTLTTSITTNSGDTLTFAESSITFSINT